MSVHLMSAIFEVEFFDLKDEEGNVTKASTAKLVLLAMADHANDEGEGAYPSIGRLARKTALSEQTIRNTFEALRHNGIISLEGKSKYGTNNHTINTSCFPRAKEKEVAYLTLQPVDPLTGEVSPSNRSSQVTLPVRPESLTIKEPSLQKVKKSLPANSGMDWMVAAGVSAVDMAATNDKIAREAEVANLYESAMGYNPLNWQDKDMPELLRFLMTKTPEEIKAFAKWSRKEYSTFPPTKARQFPLRVKEFWPLAFDTSETNSTKDGGHWL